jgi:hypothetical protein
MTSNMSADTRRQIIEYIVEADTGLTNPNWWGPPWDTTIYQIAIPYQDWATARAWTLRAELEAQPDSALEAEIERCKQRPEWSAVFGGLYEALEKTEELQRSRQYHRSLSQKGGQAHRSSKPEIIVAIKDMYAHDPEISAKLAYGNLIGTGHEMPDGTVIRLDKSKLAFQTFRTRYWPKRK